DGESRLFEIADRRMAERVVGRTGRVAGALGVRAAACLLPFLALLQDVARMSGAICGSGLSPDIASLIRATNFSSGGGASGARVAALPFAPASGRATLVPSGDTPCAKPSPPSSACSPPRRVRAAPRPRP